MTDLLVLSSLRQLFVAAGFECSGKAAIMVKGEPQTVALSMMVTMASLGSFG
jgi:hypothetical protein